MSPWKRYNAQTGAISLRGPDNSQHSNICFQQSLQKELGSECYLPLGKELAHHCLSLTGVLKGKSVSSHIISLFFHWNCL